MSTPARPTPGHALPTTSIAALIAIISLLVLTMVSPVAAAPIPGGVGFKDHSYAGDLDEPTEDKPQSKVWFADGIWWAGMWNPSTNRHEIYKRVGQAWQTTGVVLDSRSRSHGDYLWDGSNLFLASVSGDSQAEPILIFKYSYNAGTDTYALDPAFRENRDTDAQLELGRTAGQGPSETVTIAKDGTGQLWITYQNAIAASTDRNVMVNSSQPGGQHVWGTPFPLPTAPVITGDDISAIVSFGSAVGVMWTDQAATPDGSRFEFSTHPNANADAAWTPAETAASHATDEQFVDDHINLKATADGRVLAAVKTNAGLNHVQLLQRATNGTWSARVVVGGGIDATRPQVVVNSSTNEAYVLYTLPVLASDPGDQAIFYKKAGTASGAFPSGNGSTFISEGGVDINDISTSKHAVTSATGLLGIAASETNFTYYHGFLPLGTPPAHPFTDISGSTFEDDIVWLYQEGITGGCAPDRFCPNAPVTRGQMATFLDRALDLPDATQDYFTDDNGTTHEDSINRVREAGIAFGCTETTFCPNASVTRGQMAAFLDRALDLPDTSNDYFTDDESSSFEDSINRVRAAGIASGCTATTYCPNSPVTRGQMAAFLHRALGD